MKPSTTQKCSILCKYAQHLLLTKKSLCSRQPACMNKSSYDWESQRKITVFWTALLSTGSQEKRRSLQAWPMAVADIPQRWQRTDLTAKGTKQWALPAHSRVDREAPSALQGTRAVPPQGKERKGRGCTALLLAGSPPLVAFFFPRSGYVLIRSVSGGEKPPSLHPRFQNYRVPWGGGLGGHIWFGNDSLGGTMEPEGLFLIFSNGKLARDLRRRFASEGRGLSPVPSAGRPGHILPHQPHSPAAEPPARSPVRLSRRTHRRRSAERSAANAAAPRLAQLRSRRRPAAGWRTRCLWPRSGEICHHPARIPHFLALGQPFFFLYTICLSLAPPSADKGCRAEPSRPGLRALLPPGTDPTSVRRVRKSKSLRPLEEASDGTRWKGSVALDPDGPGMLRLLPAPARLPPARAGVRNPP